MRGIYDRPLGEFVRKFQEGWHVLLVGDGFNEPAAHLGLHPKTGRIEVLGQTALPLQKLPAADLAEVMVREVDRNAAKRIITIAVRPELLGLGPAPPPFVRRYSSRQMAIDEWLQALPGALIGLVVGVLLLIGCEMIIC